MSIEQVMIHVRVPRFLDPQRFWFDIGTSVGDAARTVSLALGYLPSRPSFSEVGEVLDRDILLTKADKGRSFELVDVGGAV